MYRVQAPRSHHRRWLVAPAGGVLARPQARRHAHPYRHPGAHHGLAEPDGHDTLSYPVRLDRVADAEHDGQQVPRVEPDAGPGGARSYSWETLSESDDVSAIAQKTYTNGFKCHMEYSLDAGSVEFLVPKDAKTFTITAGQSDYSRDTNVTVTFEISDPISDKVLDSASLRLNEAKEFSIDVSSVPRLKMKALVEAAPGESRKSNISITVIWADPKFS